MKILVTTIAAGLLICFSAKAQHIPDKSFAKELHTNYPDCINANNNLLPPAKKLKELRAFSDEIKDISGISGFSGLEVLVLSLNKISILPKLPANLIELDVAFNEDLAVLPQLPVSLKKLNIQNTSIRNLPANLPPQLEYLRCSNTQVTILPNLPGSLRDLWINATQIVSLPQLPDKLNFLCYNKKNIQCIPCNNIDLRVLEYESNEFVTPSLCNGDHKPAVTDKNYVRSPEKTFPKVYFFYGGRFSFDDGGDDHYRIEDEYDQPVSEFYRTVSGLTAVIYLGKAEHPDPRYNEISEFYRFEVYSDAYQTSEPSLIETYKVKVYPKQRSVWKYIPFGNLDGTNFIIKVCKGEFSHKPIAEGKVSRTQNR
jgi:Leucine-rich repeat (LRR) protein